MRAVRVFLITGILVAGSSVILAYDNPWKDVRGVNYVPSYSHNPIETWMSYNRSIIERELSMASDTLGMNSVRIFMSFFVWYAQRESFLQDYDHFVGACAARGIKPLIVLLDDDFYDPPGVNSTAGIQSYLEGGEWRGAKWMANPGIPVASSDKSSGWGTILTYLTDLTGGARANDSRILGYDMCNEPHRPYPFTGGLAELIVFATQHVESLTAVHATLDAYSGAPQNLTTLETALSFHSYWQYGHPEQCKANAATVCNAQATAGAAQYATAKRLNKPVLVSEMGQFDCYCPAAKGFRQAGVGWIAWELMMEHDQFFTFQGILFKNGTARSDVEAECLKSLASTPVEPCV